MSDGLRRDYPCPCAGCSLDCLDYSPAGCHLQPGDFHFITEAKEGKGRLFIMQPEEISELVRRRQERGLDRFGKPEVRR